VAAHIPHHGSRRPVLLCSVHTLSCRAAVRRTIISLYLLTPEARHKLTPTVLRGDGGFLPKDRRNTRSCGAGKARPALNARYRRYDMASATKQLRRKYGVTLKPIQGSRILVKSMDHDFGMPAHSVLVINDGTYTYTSANVYGEVGDQHLGKGYDPTRMTHPLPSSDGGKWKIWKKKGYVPGSFSDFPIFEQVKTTKPEPAKS
jgi:hypothetical protein